MKRTRWIASAAAAALVLVSWAAAQTHGVPEDFTAVAIANDELGAGAGRIDIRITRWSTDAERQRLVTTLREKGPRAALDALIDMRPVGTIKTPDSLAYDLRYAHQTPLEEGGRQIVFATDRPIGFWEAANRPRTIEYPFVVGQMQIGPDNEGKGTLSYAAKVRAYGDIIELENFSISPIMLTKITAQQQR